MGSASDPKFTRLRNLEPWPGGAAPVDPRDAVVDGFSPRGAERETAVKKQVELPHVVAFRVDAEAKMKLERVADAHGLKAAAFARKIVLETIDAAAVVPRVTRRIMHGDELRKLLGELGRQGANLNQVAKHLNSGGRVSDLATHIQQLRAEHSVVLRAVTRFIVGADE